MQSKLNLRSGRVLSALAPCMLLFAQAPAMSASDGDSGGAVYVMTNSASGNAVMVYEREEDGTLIHTQDVLTGGAGSGGSKDPLGSQGALTLSKDGHFLFAVNAGSSDLSVLEVSADGVSLKTRVPSGGTRPVSVTVHDGLVYVLNAGGVPNVTGFRLTPWGQLGPIGSHPLAGGVNSGPAEVSFTPDGGLLFVTEKNSNLIDVFSVDQRGHIDGSFSGKSNNTTPFGFTFARHQVLLITEVGNGVNASTMSSYAVSDDDADSDAFRTVSKSVPVDQTATCWVVATRNGRFAFTANTANDTIASFRVSARGALTLIKSNAGEVSHGSIPTDMALTDDSRFLYVIGAGTGSLTGFQVDRGDLSPATTVTGIPASAQGIAAR